jgi:2,3-bisphosphoglycerate-independent phosphoglycerate mutase
MANQEKVLLIILDGWGVHEAYNGNAIAQAKTPTFDRLWSEYPHCLLATSGESVGLPEGQMGTSEVNHMTIGAGRVIFQDLVKINRAMEDKTFFSNPAILRAFAHVKNISQRSILKAC